MSSVITSGPSAATITSSGAVPQPAGALDSSIGKSSPASAAAGPASGPGSTPDLEALKTRQQLMWASGDYVQIGTRLQLVGESLCEFADIGAPDRVIDVAAGNGNASLAAARRFADVTSTDYVPELLEAGRRRALADGLPIRFEVADAENLPFETGAFDVGISTFGIMFAPNQRRAAAELARVVRRGGRIALANWTPEGFIGKFFRVMAKFVPSPAGVDSPMKWGTEAGLGELFPRASEVRVQRKHYMFRFASPEHFVDVFRTYYGPTHKAFAALDENRRQELHASLVELLRTENQGGADRLTVPGEYLEVSIVN